MPTTPDLSAPTAFGLPLRLPAPEARIGDLLEQPNRSLLLRIIQQDPRINFRSLSRAAGLAAGTARHHLSKLVHARMVVEQPYGPMRVFFPNDAAFASTWHVRVLLREPALASLHAWIIANPNCSQGTIVD